MLVVPIWGVVMPERVVGVIQVLNKRDGTFERRDQMLLERIAAALIVLLATAFGGLGAVLLARVPRVETLVLGALAVWSYFISQLGPVFHAPDWLMRTLLFELFGTPLTGAQVRWGGEVALVALASAGVALAALVMRRRDVGDQRRHSRSVGEEGVEPSRSFEHKNLNLARMPVPPLAQAGGYSILSLSSSSSVER